MRNILRTTELQISKEDNVVGKLSWFPIRNRNHTISSETRKQHRAYILWIAHNRAGCNSDSGFCGAEISDSDSDQSGVTASYKRWPRPRLRSRSWSRKVEQTAIFAGAGVDSSDSDSGFAEPKLVIPTPTKRESQPAIRADRDSDSGVGVGVGVGIEKWIGLRFFLEAESIAPTPTPAFLEPKLFTLTPTKSESQAALVHNDLALFRFPIMFEFYMFHSNGGIKSWIMHGS
jgi:hypothetical protein